MQQPQGILAIFEDELDALRAAVMALGGTKVVGNALRPDLSVEAAAGWLKDCLNRERREKLDLSQVMEILRRAKAAGHHAPMQYIGNEIGYQVQPVEPADEIAELQRQFITAVHASKHIADRIERLTQPSLSVSKAA